MCWVQAVQEGQGVPLTAVHSGLVSVNGCVRRHVLVRASLSSAVRPLGRHHLLMAWVVWHHSGCLLVMCAHEMAGADSALSCVLWRVSVRVWRVSPFVLGADQ